MRAKGHALIRNFAQFGKTEHLEAARIGQNRMRPGHELVQPAESAHSFMPRTQIQMISIGENDLDAQLFERLVAQALYGRLRADRHEERRLHRPAGRIQNAAPRPSRSSFCYFKRKTHTLSVSGEDKRESHANGLIDGPNGKHNAKCAAHLYLLRIERSE